MWSDFAQDRETLFWIGGLSIAMFIGSLILLPVVLVRLREDYFMPRGKAELPRRWPPAVRWAVLILKNMLGVVMVLAGIAMFVLPGQGVLTIIVGLVLLDFPGKRALELRLVLLPRVLRSINSVRARFGRLPLRLPRRGAS
jgi:Putative transmembrane protein (PGPGW)